MDLKIVFYETADICDIITSELYFWNVYHNNVFYWKICSLDQDKQNTKLGIDFYGSSPEESVNLVPRVLAAPPRPVAGRGEQQGPWVRG